METNDHFVYPSSSDKLYWVSPSCMSRAFSENENMDYEVLQQQEPNQVVLEKEKRRSWKAKAKIAQLGLPLPSSWSRGEWRVKNHGGRQVAASAEEMQRLDKDVFNPLDIFSIISKNSKKPTENWGNREKNLFVTSFSYQNYYRISA